MKYLVYASGKESQFAVNFACKKALRRGNTVEILHVIAPIDTQNLFGVIAKVNQERWQEAEDLVKSISDKAFEYSGIIPAIQIREGKIGEEIIAATLKDNAISMLVIGASQESRGMETINWLTAKLGSRLLIPLMLVPGNLTDLQINELS